MHHQLNSLHGALLRSDMIAGLSLSETAYARGLRLAPHSHRSPYFCFVLRGGFTESRGGRGRTCDRATLIFHPQGEAHADEFHAESRCFNVEMNAAWTGRGGDPVSSLLRAGADFRGGEVARLAARLYGEFRRADALSPLIVEALVLEIVAEAARKSAAHRRGDAPRWLARVRERLDAEFRDPPSLVQLAAASGVHETHLCREFRRHFRCTAGEHVRRRRVEFASRQLCASDAPLSELALAAGFADQSHFARTFKRLTGWSPAAYRKTFRTR